MIKNRIDIHHFKYDKTNKVLYCQLSLLESKTKLKYDNNQLYYIEGDECYMIIHNPLTGNERYFAYQPYAKGIVWKDTLSDLIITLGI